jgi:hypothetical protein
VMIYNLTDVAESTDPYNAIPCDCCETVFNSNENGHIDDETGLAFCCPECEWDYYIHKGLPIEYKLPPSFPAYARKEHEERRQVERQQARREAKRIRLDRITAYLQHLRHRQFIRLEKQGQLNLFKQ